MFYLQKKYWLLSILFFQIILFLSCRTVQQSWVYDVTSVEKDLLNAKKNGLILFTVSDTDPQSIKLQNNVFTDSFFKKAGKKFLLYNVNIVHDETLMPAKVLEKNYRAFSKYNVLEVPHLCLMTIEGDVYHSDLIPPEIDTINSFLEYLEMQESKRLNVVALKQKINAFDDYKKIEAIDEFFNHIYFVDSEKYRSLFEQGIKSDSENKTGLAGKFILTLKDLDIAKLLIEKNYEQAVSEFLKTLDEKNLKPEERQSVWINAAYIAVFSKTVSEDVVITYLENAVESCPNSERVGDIKKDIAHLKQKSKKN